MANAALSNTLFDIFLQANPNALGSAQGITDPFNDSPYLANFNNQQNGWLDYGVNDLGENYGDYSEPNVVGENAGVSRDFNRSDAPISAARILQYYLGAPQGTAQNETSHNVFEQAPGFGGFYDEVNDKTWGHNDVKQSLEDYFMGTLETPTEEVNQGIEGAGTDAAIQMRQNLASRGLVGAPWNDWINREISRARTHGYDDAYSAAIADYENQVRLGSSDIFSQATNLIGGVDTGGQLNDIERIGWSDQPAYDAWIADNQSPVRSSLDSANQQIDSLVGAGVEASINPNLVNIFSSLIDKFPRASTVNKLAGSPTVPDEWLNTDISSYFTAGGKASPAQKEHKGTVNK